MEEDGTKGWSTTIENTKAIVVFFVLVALCSHILVRRQNNENSLHGTATWESSRSKSSWLRELEQDWYDT